MKSYSKYSRRNFIKKASCAAIGTVSLYSTLLDLQSLNASAIYNSDNGDDYKALVCIMLRGGNDAFNTIIPRDPEGYSEYQQVRSNLAIPQNEIIPLYPVNYNQQELGFHPSLSELAELFASNKLSVVCNVGTLVQATSRADYINGQNLPSGLFSHSDQSHHWQTSLPQSNSPTGWGGRLADLVYSANSNQQISMNISLAGKNVFQLGNQVAEYSIRPIGNGSVGIKGYGGNSTFDQLRTSLVNNLMEKQYQDIFKQSYADVVIGSQNAHELFSGAISQSTLNTTFSDTALSDSLRMVARTIAVRESLGMKRQTFYVQLDGWDHHDDLIYYHERLLQELSRGLYEFQIALEELEVDDCVTTFTISDFGRTLTSNGNGSDHAWGSNMLVMGKQVNGREVYGNYPALSLNNPLIVDDAVIIPQMSTDEYFAELALWYGVAKSDLVQIFPNIGNFYDVFSDHAPVGFMKI